MKIIKILSQHRRDFRAVYCCENCGQEVEERGYDDRNFHDNVVPNMKCKECGKSRTDLGIKGEYVGTKYPEGLQV
jgi:hypothetical protein